jgi:hypothetical protein
VSASLRHGASLAVAGLVLALAQARAQGVEARVGHFYQDNGWTLYRVGLSRPLWGPVGLGLSGGYLQRDGAADGGFAGVGADLTLFRGGRQGPYLVGGLDGGLGSGTSGSFSQHWGGWSAGMGYQLFPASFFSVDVEGRWRELTPGVRSGFQLSAGLALHFGGRATPPPAQPKAPVAAPGPVDGAPTRLADSVIATAREAMGRRYQLGGTGEDGEGFDCSGLIQYAYGEHGIRLPRTSGEQAREGKEIAREPALLMPGDLLTFSNRGGPVTHVGLYIGDGKFIHSASRGVQVSVLSADDPYGRWWYRRWIGVRRIIQ